jgi:3-oxoadipate enol-lactonase
MVTTPQDFRQVADRIPGAQYAELDAAHLSNWEQPDAFTAHVVGFLTKGA